MNSLAIEAPRRLRAALHALDIDRHALHVYGYQPPNTVTAKWQPRSAAVLIGVTGGTAPQVLLTKRSQHVPTHAGQISFPGGAVEKQDSGVIAAALRETEEEVGLSIDLIKPLGLLDVFDTVSGFRIYPVVASLSDLPPLRLDPGEVEEAFTVPLEFLLNQQNYQQHTVRRDGQTYRYYAIEWQQHMIWGATAGILYNLLERYRGIGA